MRTAGEWDELLLRQAALAFLLPQVPVSLDGRMTQVNEARPTGPRPANYLERDAADEGALGKPSGQNKHT